MTELDERVHALEAEIAMHGANDDPTRRAALLLRLGANLHAVGQHMRGSEALDEALALFEEHGDPRGAAETLNTIAAAVLEERPGEARDVLERALGIARSAGEHSEEASSLNNLAILDELAGDLDRAIMQYEQTLELLRAVGDRQKLATTLNNLGVALEKRGEPDAARDTWTEALAIHESLGDVPGCASTLNNMGSALERCGEVVAAIEHYERALAMQERVGDVGEQIVFLGNLRLAYFKVGRREDGVAATQRKIVLLERIGEYAAARATLADLAEELERAGLSTADLHQR